MEGWERGFVVVLYDIVNYNIVFWWLTCYTLFCESVWY
jgi:hypothetical protein